MSHNPSTSFETTPFGALGQPLDHVRHTLTLPFPQIRQASPAEPQRAICLIGSGPSRANYLNHLHQAKQQNYELWALGDAYGWLMEQGFEPDVHILASADPKEADHVPEHSTAILLYASHCHPEVFLRASAASPKVVVWHPMIDGITALPAFGESTLIGGGSTPEMMAITLAFTIGGRSLHLFGYDSSFADDTSIDPDSGEVQPDQKIYVQVDERRFVSSMRLAQQLNEFRLLLKTFIPQGLGVTMHGEGLLPYTMQKMMAKSKPN